MRSIVIIMLLCIGGVYNGFSQERKSTELKIEINELKQQRDSISILIEEKEKELRRVTAEEQKEYFPAVVELSGRKMIEKPVLKKEVFEEGRVKFEIEVDRVGRITDYRVSKETKASKELIQVAEEMLEEVRFDANLAAPPSQDGAVIFNFKFIE